MKRRQFAFKTGILIAGGAFGVHFLQSCDETEQVIDEAVQEEFLKSGNLKGVISEARRKYLDGMIGKSYDMLFAGLKNAFRQKRIVLVVSSYKIMDVNKDKFGRDIDCMVRFNLHGQLRFNFDFFNSGFETGSMIFEKNGSKMLIDREYLKTMKVMGKVNNHSFLDFPIRFNTGNQTPEFDTNFKLPCVMRKSDLNKYLCSSGIKNLVNGLT